MYKLDLTSQHEDLTRRHKDLTSQHNHLTSDGRNMPRNMPPYWTVKSKVYIYLYSTWIYRCIIRWHKKTIESILWFTTYENYHWQHPKVHITSQRVGQKYYLVLKSWYPVVWFCLPSLKRKKDCWKKNVLVYANIYVKWCITFAHFSVCFERAVKPTPFKRLSFSLFLLCSNSHCQIFFFLFWFTELTTEKIAKKKMIWKTINEFYYTNLLRIILNILKIQKTWFFNRILSDE